MYARSTGTSPSLHVYMMTTDRLTVVQTKSLHVKCGWFWPKMIQRCCFWHVTVLNMQFTLSRWADWNQLPVDHLLRGFGKKYKFFSSLALRDISKHLLETWCSVHGDKSGLLHAKKLWAKAIRGAMEFHYWSRTENAQCGWQIHVGMSSEQSPCFKEERKNTL